MSGKTVAMVMSVCLLLTAQVFAHHAFSAEFDANKPLKLTGAVTKVEWQNPHTWFYIDVKDETGQTKNWGARNGKPESVDPKRLDQIIDEDRGCRHRRSVSRKERRKHRQCQDRYSGAER